MGKLEEAKTRKFENPPKVIKCSIATDEGFVVVCFDDLGLRPPPENSLGYHVAITTVDGRVFCGYVDSPGSWTGENAREDARSVILSGLAVNCDYYLIARDTSQIDYNDCALTMDDANAMGGYLIVDSDKTGFVRRAVLELADDVDDGLAHEWLAVVKNRPAAGLDKLRPGRL